MKFIVACTTYVVGGIVALTATAIFGTAVHPLVGVGIGSLAIAGTVAIIQGLAPKPVNKEEDSNE